MANKVAASKYDKFISRYQNRFNLEIDKDWSARESKLTILQKFLDGSIYDNLLPYHQEYVGNTGTYVRLADRRPSVVYNICQLIVDDSVSMLFGDEHFPTVKCDKHENTTQFLQQITKDCYLKEAMINAAEIGSIGSVCVLIKVLNGHFYYDVLNTKDLVPTFDSQKPDCLVRLYQKRKVDGATLKSFGYNILDKDKNEIFYVCREWNDQEEIYYKPYLCNDEREDYKPTKDSDRSFSHDFGFVPAVWIKNLPHAHHIDGRCTFESILDISIEIDYQLSQLGRLLKYNSDPTLVIKNPGNWEGQQLVKGIGTLNLDEGGDAYLLEMSTGATKSVIDYVKTLRDYALEKAHGNRLNPEKMSVAHSGKAMQMLQTSLISLVEKMRLSYGNSGLLKIYDMTLAIYHNNAYEFEYDIEPDAECDGDLSLIWPDWYPQLAIDKLQQAQALQVLLDNSVISQESAINYIASQYDIHDTEKEKNAIESDQKNDYDNKLNDNAEKSGVDRRKSEQVALEKKSAEKL